LSAVIVTASPCLSASARRVNSGIITTFYGGTPLWRPRAKAALNLEGRDLNC